MKKIIAIIILFLLIGVAVLINFLFFKKKSVDPIFKYGIIARENVNYDGIKKVGNVFLVNNGNKYGLLNDEYKVIVDVEYDYNQANDSFVLLTKDGRDYIFNKNGKLLNQASVIDIVDNMYGNNLYYYVRSGSSYTIYNLNGDNVYTGNKNPLYAVGDALVFDNYYYDVSNKNNTSFSDSFFINGGIVFNDSNGCMIFMYADGKFTRYKSYSEFTSNNKIIRINDNYSLDYNGCTEGSYLVSSDGSKVSDKCYYNYDLDYISKNVLIYDLGDYKNIVFGNKKVEATDYQRIGDYLLVYNYHESPITGKVYDFDGNEKDLMCNIKSYFDENYVCSDGIYYYFINKDSEIVSDRFYDITCYKEICAVKNDSGKYALFKDGLLTKFIYYDIYENSGYAFGYNADSIDILKIGWDTTLMNGFEIRNEVSSYSDRELIDIIYQYDLNSIKEEIMKDKDLFTLYAKKAIGNPNLKNYLNDVLLAFKAVSMNREYLDERSLIEALGELSIEKVSSLHDANVAGIYTDSSKRIEMVKDDKRVIMHELLHFIDFNINDSNSNIYVCNDKLVSVNDYESYLYVNKLSECERDNSDFTFLVEAGAEYYTSLIFNNRTITSYNYATMIYGFFDSIYGKDSLRKVFFSPNGNYDFYDLLMKCGLSYGEAKELIEQLYHVTKLGDSDGDCYLKVALTLAKIVSNKYKINWYENGYYKYVIGNLMDEALFVKNVNYDNYNITSYLEYLPIELDQIVKKVNINFELRDHFTSTIVEDGKKYVTLTVYDENNLVNYLVVDYDFKNEKVNNYNLYPYLA